MTFTKSLVERFNVELAPVYVDAQSFGSWYARENPTYHDDRGRVYAYDYESLHWRRVDDTALMILIAASLKGVRSYYERLLESGDREERSDARRFLSQTDVSKPAVRNQLRYAVLDSARLQRFRPRTPFHVQMGRVVVNLQTKEEYEAGPEWFFTSPIPWTPGDSTETPMLDSYLESWAGSQAGILKETILACVADEYAPKRVTWLYGTGDNGKSSYEKVAKRFLGEQNVVATTLSELTRNRFDAARLEGAKAAVIGEVDDRKLQYTSILKSLSGGDEIRFERKGRDATTGVNSAYVIIASNHLPLRSDFSHGLAKRIVPVVMRSLESQGVKLLPSTEALARSIPDSEYEALARWCVERYAEFYNQGGYTGEDEPLVRMRAYDRISDPLGTFIESHTLEDDESYVLRDDFKTRLSAFCREHGLQLIDERALRRYMRSHYDEKRRPPGLSPDRYRPWVYWGLRWMDETPIREWVRGYGEGGAPLVEAHRRYGAEVVNRLVEVGDLFESPAGVLRCT